MVLGGCLGDFIGEKDGVGVVEGMIEEIKVEEV